MKRLLLILFLFFAGSALVVMLIRRNGGGISDDVFNAGKETEITRIRLRSADADICLEKRAGEWLLNDSEPVRNSAISFILAALADMQPRSSVSEDVFNHLISESNGDPVHVKVFSGKRRRASFDVYHFNDPHYSSIVKKNRRDKPFLVYLPGYDFDPGGVFTADTDFWKPFRVFNIMPSSIKEVKMYYYTDTIHSFELKNEGKRLALLDSSVFDTLSGRRYLSYFVNVSFESLTTGLTSDKITEITSGEPYFELTVTTTDGKKRVLKGWRRNILKDGIIITDTDRLWGSLDDGKLFVLRYLDIDPLIKKRSYFLPGE